MIGEVSVNCFPCAKAISESFGNILKLFDITGDLLDIQKRKARLLLVTLGIIDTNHFCSTSQMAKKTILIEM